MNVLDSSGWIEYFTDSKNAERFAPIAEDTSNLLVPSITLFEVFRWTASNVSEDAAFQAVAHMRQGRVIDLDSALAIGSAHLSLASHLPLADNIILATAYLFGAQVWTQDVDFKGRRDVHYVPKTASA